MRECQSQRIKATLRHRGNEVVEFEFAMSVFYCLADSEWTAKPLKE